MTGRISSAPSYVPGLISVVMPCYNASAYLASAVDSVLSQSYPDVELIVVDDGSTDGSQAILKGYGNRIVRVEQKNRGPGPARNRGISMAKGELIAFLDADDWWSAECLEQLHRSLIDSRAALAYCGWQNVGKPGKAGEPYIPPDYEAGSKADRFLRTAAPWPIHAALCRRTVLDEVGGGFDEQWATCMDYDLWLRIAVARPIVLVPEVMAFYRHHDSSQITSKQWRQARNVWRVKRHFVARHPELLSGLSKNRLRDLVDGGLLRRGYDAFWKRDLVSAQRIFRMVLRTGYWKMRDLRYLLPALLPEKWFQSLVQLRGE
jgi:glycosyltransferase involved in cell wall biosynthesis